jgi:hypothetical protein
LAYAHSVPVGGWCVVVHAVHVVGIAAHQSCPYFTLLNNIVNSLQVVQHLAIKDHTLQTLGGKIGLIFVYKLFILLNNGNGKGSSVRKSVGEFLIHFDWILIQHLRQPDPDPTSKIPHI